ncbi:MAG: acyl-CoA thioesterase [Planctomycetes bacterium]|nr:acyl-CoA thioesterase [Planctomycetota bacterium]MCB9910150.1 acyl-CoA thioesterase [Planctomycetota bacterium]MCB9913083.1 acyl-CoA thioesterase [Planctomycetota bacterium]HRV82719.1 thioesterase family protein [Planctomycetota bacterium]
MELPQVPPDASLPFACELFTRWSDEDNQGVLNNAIYLTLFEEGRHRYFLGLGLLDSAQFPFLLAQTHLKFLAPGRGGCAVRLTMGTTRIGTSSFEQAYRIHGPDGTVWCEGEALLVCYDPRTGKSRAMDPDFRACLERG